MAKTAIHDMGTTTTFEGRAHGENAIIYRHNDGVTGVYVDGWDVYISAEGITIRRLGERHRNIGCLQRNDETYGQSLHITLGKFHNDVWPSSATTFATGERSLP
jgi:hypothetical protein